MKPKTKRQLNALFGLGLITAALSVGRAVTTTRKTLTEDTSCTCHLHYYRIFNTKSCIGNMIPNYYVSMFEGRLGIIFACGPAVRQFWAYRTRTRTCLPTKHRQYPNEDFDKMRFRINLRDMFWYRKAQVVGSRVFEASPIFRSMSPPPDATSGSPQKSSQVSTSALDAWEKRVQKLFPTGHHKAVRADERHFHQNSNVIH